MYIEKIKLLTTLKAGDHVWDKNSIIDAPIPVELIAEIRAETGHIEILKPPKTQQPLMEVRDDRIVEEKVEEDEPTPSEDSSSTKSLHIFINPKGEEVLVENLYAFTKENNFSYSGFHGLIKGKAKSCKGWTLKKG